MRIRVTVKVRARVWNTIGLGEIVRVRVRVGRWVRVRGER